MEVLNFEPAHNGAKTKNIMPKVHYDATHILTKDLLPKYHLDSSHVNAYGMTPLIHYEVSHVMAHNLPFVETLESQKVA